MTCAPEDQIAVLEEIRLLLAEAVQEGDVVRPDVVATYIATAYPQNEFGVGVISARIIAEALALGLPVEVGSTGGGKARLALPQLGS